MRRGGSAWREPLALLAGETLLFVIHWPLWGSEAIVSGVVLAIVGVVGLLAIPFGYALKRGWSPPAVFALLLALPVGGVASRFISYGPVAPYSEIPWWGVMVFVLFPVYGVALLGSTFLGLAVSQYQAFRSGAPR